MDGKGVNMDGKGFNMNGKGVDKEGTGFNMDGTGFNMDSKGVDKEGNGGQHGAHLVGRACEEELVNGRPSEDVRHTSHHLAGRLEEPFVKLGQPGVREQRLASAEPGARRVKRSDIYVTRAVP
eukprot:4412915-Pyramimonas_sp.AAC.1